MRRRLCSSSSPVSTKPMLNSLISLLLLLLVVVATSHFRVVEAVGTNPEHVEGGAEGLQLGVSGSIPQPAPFDVDDALAAARAAAAQAAAGSTPLSPAAAATAGRTAMANACGPGLGKCTLAMGGCCSERGTCGWECRSGGGGDGGGCQRLFSAPGFCDGGEGSAPSRLPLPASSLPLFPLGSPCGAYLARCSGGLGGRRRTGEMLQRPRLLRCRALPPLQRQQRQF